MWYLSLPKVHGVKINGETSPARLQRMGGVARLIIRFPLYQLGRAPEEHCLTVRTLTLMGEGQHTLDGRGKAQLSNTIMTKKMGKDEQL